MNYSTYIPMQQAAPQPIMQRPMYQPQPMMRPMYGAPSTLIRVNGRAGAEAYPLDAANSEVALFDANEDIFYFKTTDGGGYPSMRAYRFEPLPEPGATPTVVYASREELEVLRAEIAELKGVISSGKQPRKPKADEE